MNSSRKKTERAFVVGCSLMLVLLFGADVSLAQTGPDDAGPGAAGPANGAVAGEQVLQPPLQLRPAPSVVQLFTGTVKDFRHVPSTGNFVLLGVGGAAALAVYPQDARLTRRLSESRDLSGAFRPGRTIGGAAFQIAGSVGTYALGQFTGSSKTAWVGADLIRAQMVAQTLTGVLKVSVGRTRPDGAQFSFPSGHSSVSFASATVLERHLGWKAGIPAYAVASYVAASRLHHKRHYLSDVTFGAAVGIVAGRSMTVGRGSARFAVAPAPVQSGGAIVFTWVGNE
jgi:membrane-associated phospholipid phosphatase